MQVFQSFYGVEGFGSAVMYAAGVAKLLRILGFAAGLKKRFTYGAPAPCCPGGGVDEAALRAVGVGIPRS